MKQDMAEISASFIPAYVFISEPFPPHISLILREINLLCRSLMKFDPLGGGVSLPTNHPALAIFSNGYSQNQ